VLKEFYLKMLHYAPRNAEEASGKAPEIMATVIHDFHGVPLVDFTPPGSIANAVACQESQRTLLGAQDQDS
jgi:hypothetical protein